MASDGARDLVRWFNRPVEPAPRWRVRAWWGQPWGAQVNGLPRAELPAGQPCAGCLDPIRENDQGLSVHDAVYGRERPWHLACFRELPR